MNKRALISVSDKTGISDFAKELEMLGFEIISTGGTYRILREAGVNVIAIDHVTGLPECLDGRLKTLHYKVHGGILAVRSNTLHMEQISDLGLDLIDLVAVNFYPFKQTIGRSDANLEKAIENIDIGGPTMLRAAAKNYQDVTAVVDPNDYNKIITEIKSTGRVSVETNFRLAAKVFAYTAEYDCAIATYLQKKSDTEMFPPILNLTYKKVQDLRYGENPHQQAALYKEDTTVGGNITDIIQLHGKELSFNNFNDIHGALELLREFDEPTVVACKHSVPCGVGSAKTIVEAYQKAYSADPTSIFGGVLTVNREIDEKIAALINKIFLEVVLAPGYTLEALKLLTGKKNIRILQLNNIRRDPDIDAFDVKKVSSGILVQQNNQVLLGAEPVIVVTKRQPTEKEMKDLLFTWKIVKHVKSNGIAIGKDGQSVGIGTGQVNRIWATLQAISHAQEQLGSEVLKGAVLASDAYFPFGDCVEAAAKVGITAIIQSGGSVNDQISIDSCDAYGIAMVFTGIRHFRH